MRGGGRMWLEQLLSRWCHDFGVAVRQAGSDGDFQTRDFGPPEREEALVMARPKKYPDELIQRGVRLALESGRPIAAVARDLGMHPETLRKRVRQAEADSLSLIHI